jgi:diguanylate cyclase (GGDEF)-like protein/PAS domain S-box-containing protein
MYIKYADRSVGGINLKVITKIAVYLIPVTLVLVISINISFAMFFQGYVKKQEQNQIDLIADNIASFLSDKRTSYVGNVNDWAHWNDTYNFISSGSQEYVTDNLMSSTFENLELSFMTFLDKDDSILYERLYSLEDSRFTDVPFGFHDELGKVITFVKNGGDHFGIFLLGGSYYFIVSSDVTDSLDVAPKNGTLIFGRQIDKAIVETLEKNTGCRISSIRAASATDHLTAEGGTVQIMNLTYFHDSLQIDMALPNSYDMSESMMLSIIMSRALYVSEMNSLYTYSAVSLALSVLASMFIFVFLGRTISKPFSDLLRDVKRVDAADFKTACIQETGSKEFRYLRKTINRVLCRIEAEQKELTRKSEELNITLNSVGDGVIAVDHQHRIQFINPVAQSLTGWNKDTALGQPIEQVFRIINEYTREAIPSPVDTVLTTGKIAELENHTILIAQDGSERAIEDTAAPIKDDSGTLKGCVLVFRDYSERKEKQRYIEYLSYHDQLTGLYNRRFLDDELKRLDDGSKLPLSFIYADLNGLKIINDAFGHENGDKVIKWVAEVLTSTCRPDDIIARIGGDEFLLLLPQTDEAIVEKIVGELDEKIAKLSYMNIEISTSFGWSTKKESSQSSADVLRIAEDLMYRKKILNNTSKRNGIIKLILHTLHIKCPREEAHSRRVSSICESIAKEYGLNSDDIRELKIAGELHDIGKIAIDISILDKTGKLSESEWSQIKHHPEIGYRLLGSTNEFNNIAEYILAHHERWDGKGYPKGLKAEGISWKARVISIADSFDAMTCDRPYHTALSIEEAAAEIKRCSGTQFDADIARVFIEKVLKLEW